MKRSPAGRAVSRQLRRATPRAARWAPALLAAALSTGCVAPALDSGAFRQNAVHALDSGVSETRTAALGLENLLDHRVPEPYADIVVTDTEEAIGPVQDSFGTVDPPTRADEVLRDRVTGLLSDAGDALSHARIALRKGDPRAMSQSVQALRGVADRMEQESERLQ